MTRIQKKRNFDYKLFHLTKLFMKVRVQNKLSTLIYTNFIKKTIHTVFGNIVKFRKFANFYKILRIFRGKIGLQIFL